MICLSSCFLALALSSRGIFLGEVKGLAEALMSEEKWRLHFIVPES